MNKVRSAAASSFTEDATLFSSMRCLQQRSLQRDTIGGGLAAKVHAAQACLPQFTAFAGAGIVQAASYRHTDFEHQRGASLQSPRTVCSNVVIEYSTELHDLGRCQDFEVCCYVQAFAVLVGCGSLLRR